MSIEVRGLSKAFDGHAVLRDVSLHVPSGELVALLGPSGCGKTTLLRIIAGLELADRGEVLHEGEAVQGKSARDRNVGLVFQHYALFRHMTVAENVAFALRVRRRPQPEVRARVRELLDLVQLAGLERRFPHQLSGGQRQRVALARALATEPRVLLLDEPFGALDARVREELRRWLRRLHDEIHVTTVFVTHDQEEAFEVSDRVVLMNQGRVEQEGTPRQVFEGRAQLFVRPHEIALSATPGPDSFAAEVRRVTPLGASARVELATAIGPLEAEIDARAAEELALAPGARVFAAPRRLRAFPPEAQDSLTASGL
jgi:sulfate/thiosulfate transport system ATP-binding protein